MEGGPVPIWDGPRGSKCGGLEELPAWPASPGSVSGSPVRVSPALSSLSDLIFLIIEETRELRLTERQYFSIPVVVPFSSGIKHTSIPSHYHRWTLKAVHCEGA